MRSLLRQLRLSLRRRLLGKGKPHPAEYWDASFPSGRWAYLDSAAESPRFRAVATLISRHHHRSAIILDVGCGTGTLFRYLSPELRPAYVGTDISGQALAQARRGCGPSTVFLREPADAHASGTAAAYAPYGVVVLSEVLYYLDDPFRTIRFYRDLLLPDGVFIISLWNPCRHAVLRWRLRRQLHVLTSQLVASPGKADWELTVAR
jgi:SAM-dependent methyltransferase